jgi:tetratricopeptide (TPR) repeat protein
MDLAFVYLQVDRLEDAEQMAKAAMASNPRKARALLVRIAGSRGDLRKAEALAQDLARDPNASAGDIELLAEVTVARGDLSVAMNLLNDAERRAAMPGQKIPYGLYALRGEILVREGRKTDAIAAYEQEIAAFPHHIAAYSTLGRLYRETGRVADAERTRQRLAGVTASHGR